MKLSVLLGVPILAATMGASVASEWDRIGRAIQKGWDDAGDALEEARDDTKDFLQENFWDMYSSREQRPAGSPTAVSTPDAYGYPATAYLECADSGTPSGNVGTGRLEVTVWSKESCQDAHDELDNRYGRSGIDYCARAQSNWHLVGVRKTHNAICQFR